MTCHQPLTDLSLRLNLSAPSRLNVQAHQCVVNNTDEFVVESLMSFDKLPVLVHELVLIETWKHKVLDMPSHIEINHAKYIHHIDGMPYER